MAVVVVGDGCHAAVYILTTNIVELLYTFHLNFYLNCMRILLSLQLDILYLIIILLPNYISSVSSLTAIFVRGEIKNSSKTNLKMKKKTPRLGGRQQ